MKKLYEKNELGFALLWIGVYCAAGVPLRGAEGNAGGKESPQKGRSPGGQDAGVLPRGEGLRQEGPEA